MSWITLEHSPVAYRLDFALYGLASAAMATVLLLASPDGRGGSLALWALGGLASWSLAEYALHRYVLHGVQPFKRWHAEHHRRPTALMGSPTAMSALLFATLVAAPAWWLLGAWPALALTFGQVTGYLAYGLTHHATHHAVPLKSLQRSAWLARRRRWHAVHHARRGPAVSAQARDALTADVRPEVSAGHFGVSSRWWDDVFGTNVGPR